MNRLSLGTGLLLLALGMPGAAGAFVPEHGLCGTPAKLAEPAWRNGDERPGTNSILDSSLYPMRVHFYAGEEANAQLLLAEAEEAWRLQVDEWGFLPPLADPGWGGSDRFDLYLADTEFGGYFSPETYTSSGVVRCIGHLVVNRLMEPQAIASVVHHEFHHAVQAAYDCIETSHAWESGATFIQFHTGGDAAGSYVDWFLGEYQQHPHRAVDWWDYAQPHQYGSSLFMAFLSERYSNGDPSFLRRSWEHARQSQFENEPDLLDAIQIVLDEDGHGDFNDLWEEYVVWRWYAGGRSDGLFWPDGIWTRPGNEVLDQGSLSPEQLPARVSPNERLQPYSMAYWRFSGELPENHDLVLELDADMGSHWAFGWIAEDDGAFAENISKRMMDGVRLDIEAPDEFDGGVLWIANLSPGNHDPDDMAWEGSRAELRVRLVDVTPPPPDQNLACQNCGGEADATGTAFGTLLLLPLGFGLRRRRG